MESLTFLKPHYLCFRMLLSKVKNNAIKHFEAVISSLAFGMSKQPLHESDMEFRLCRLWNKHFCFDLWVSIDILKTAHIDIALFAQKFTHSIFLTKSFLFMQNSEENESVMEYWIVIGEKTFGHPAVFWIENLHKECQNVMTWISAELWSRVFFNRIFASPQEYSLFCTVVAEDLN